MLVNPFIANIQSEYWHISTAWL